MSEGNFKWGHEASAKLDFDDIVANNFSLNLCDIYYAMLFNIIYIIVPM